MGISFGIPNFCSIFAVKHKLIIDMWTEQEINKLVENAVKRQYFTDSISKTFFELELKRNLTFLNFEI